MPGVAEERPQFTRSLSKGNYITFAWKDEGKKTFQMPSKRNTKKPCCRTFSKLKNSPSLSIYKTNKLLQKPYKGEVEKRVSIIKSLNLAGHKFTLFFRISVYRVIPKIQSNSGCRKVPIVLFGIQSIELPQPNALCIDLKTQIYVIKLLKISSKKNHELQDFRSKRQKRKSYQRRKIKIFFYFYNTISHLLTSQFSAESWIPKLKEKKKFGSSLNDLWLPTTQAQQVQALSKAQFEFKRLQHSKSQN